MSDNSGVDKNTRILVIDDNRAIHSDFRKILSPDRSASDQLKAEAAELFLSPTAKVSSSKHFSFEMDSAYQGEEGLELVQKAQESRPYAMAFVDVRMPPGWDGVETTYRLWKAYPDLQVVICTAYSDYSWDEMTTIMERPDQLLILKKPFETVEVVQLAHALTEKWRLHQATKLRMDQLEKVVQDRTKSLQETNVTLGMTNTELKEALATVKTLEGLLPICSHCKKIRDENNHWNQIELYIRDHSKANFSHGICPECVRKFYPQFDPSKDGNDQG